MRSMGGGNSPREALLWTLILIRYLLLWSCTNHHVRPSGQHTPKDTYSEQKPSPAPPPPRGKGDPGEMPAGLGPGEGVRMSCMAEHMSWAGGRAVPEFTN